MSNTKHTPGPWFYNPNIALSNGVHNDNHVFVAKVIHIDNAGEFEANAKLIAAAPQLLEALKQIVETAKGFELLPKKWIDPLVVAESAIEKATT